MPMPVNYVRPKWRKGNTLPILFHGGWNELNAKPDEFLQRLVALKDEELAELRADAIQTTETNKALHDTAKADHQTLCAEVVRLYGKDSNPAKYIAKQTPEYLMQDWSARHFDEQVTKHIPDARRILANRAAEAERKAGRDLVLQEAIGFLVIRGKVIGTDFSLENAVQRANDVAYTEEVARRLVELEMHGGWISFHGDESCETCNGWDGVSDRCDCGNRRVYWATTDGHSFQHPSICPEVD